MSPVPAPVGGGQQVVSGRLSPGRDGHSRRDPEELNVERSADFEADALAVAVQVECRPHLKGKPTFSHGTVGEFWTSFGSIPSRARGRSTLGRRC